MSYLSSYCDVGPDRFRYLTKAVPVAPNTQQTCVPSAPWTVPACGCVVRGVRCVCESDRSESTIVRPYCGCVVTVWAAALTPSLAPDRRETLHYRRLYYSILDYESIQSVHQYNSSSESFFGRFWQCKKMSRKRRSNAHMQILS